MSHICSRCRCVFYSNAEYKNHNCEAIQQRDQQQVKSTQGMPIEQRLAALLPVPHDKSGQIHESMTVLQSLTRYLADRAGGNDKVTLVPGDVRALVLGMHCLCDRIELAMGIQPDGGKPQ